MATALTLGLGASAVATLSYLVAGRTRFQRRHLDARGRCRLAAVGLATTLAAIKGYPLTMAIGDLSPAMHWPDPVLAWQPRFDDGPVLVTIEYCVKPPQTEGSLSAMHELERRRRRDGALQWALFHDVAQPS